MNIINKIKKKFSKNQFIIKPKKKSDIEQKLAEVIACTTACPNCLAPAYQGPCTSQACPGLGTCSTNNPIQVA